MKRTSQMMMMMMMMTATTVMRMTRTSKICLSFHLT
jgi:hypothetical protein